MNVALLRLARLHPGRIRVWTVPGAPHPVKLLPGRVSLWGVPAVSWPHLDGAEWVLRSVRLDWHRTVARGAIKKLIVSK